ncbi:Cacna1h [Symbiodinium natans]|uniref:Cacna1h protein n=1 Tax=Symbiodinium natans TaxID=878477 RepID=A0A812RI37_9DINO|nr:Cacna1h [Symbiodinium natans]
MQVFLLSGSSVTVNVAQGLEAAKRQVAKELGILPAGVRILCEGEALTKLEEGCGPLFAVADQARVAYAEEWARLEASLVGLRRVQATEPVLRARVAELSEELGVRRYDFEKESWKLERMLEQETMPLREEKALVSRMSRLRAASKLHGKNEELEVQLHERRRDARNAVQMRKEEKFLSGFNGYPVIPLGFLDCKPPCMLQALTKRLALQGLDATDLIAEFDEAAQAALIPTRNKDFYTEEEARLLFGWDSEDWGWYAWEREVLLRQLRNGSLDEHMEADCPRLARRLHECEAPEVGAAPQPPQGSRKPTEGPCSKTTSYLALIHHPDNVCLYPINGLPSEFPWAVFSELFFVVFDSEAVQTPLFPWLMRVAWWVQSVPVHKRRYCGAQLLSKLTGPARLLAMSWSTLVLDSKDGVKVMLQRLASSPLVRKSLPNAAAICQQYFSFKRNQGETIGNFLVRETLVHEEFVEAIIRLHEEKEGISQEQRDFGLPPAEEWDDEEWQGAWSWWDHDEDYLDTDRVGDRGDDSAEAEGEGGEARPRAEERPDDPQPPGTPARGTTSAAPGSSPSRSAGERTPGGRPRPQHETDQVNASPVNEMTVTDSFIMGVLRGWRLLQAAGLSAEEKRDILSATKNSLDYEVISGALQNLWDDQLLGHRHHGSSGHLNAHLADQTSIEPNEVYYEELDDWWWNNAWWNEHFYAGPDHWSEDWWTGDSNHWEPEALPVVAAEEDPKVQEAQKAEKIAESLAVEAQRTWADAQRATQALRKDRGFGGPTKCFQCGGNHMVRDCPDRRHPGYGMGKGYGKKGAYYLHPEDGDHWQENYYMNKNGKPKGKGKKGMWSEVQAMWKGRSKGKPSKGKDGYRPVNAYVTDMFVGGLELTEVLEAQTSEATKPEPTPQIGMLDCGATASAAPDAVVQGLIQAVLSHDRNAKIELDQGARTFSIYTLPNPSEYYQNGFEQSSLVPVLIGMDFLGCNGAGMMIDFATGNAMFTCDSQPQIFPLKANHKGHFTLDIVQYLTEGKRCDVGQPHVLVRAGAKASKPLETHTVLELGVVWFDLAASEEILPICSDSILLPPSNPQLPLRGLFLMATSRRVTVDPEVESVLVAAAKAKAAQAKTKVKPLDRNRVMKMDPRDPRAQRKQWPCMGRHTASAPQANAHGEWVVCSTCNVRMLYTPREGSPAQHTMAENPGMIKRMLAELQPLMGDCMPTAQICRHMLAKINAEEVLRKAIMDVKNMSTATPSTAVPTSPTATSSGWDAVQVPDDDEELVTAYENEAYGLLLTTTMNLLVGLHQHDRDGLWEIACAPHSWLSMAAEEHGIKAYRVNLTNGYDLYQPETWQHLRELRRKRRPKRLWFSLPCTKWCAWTSVNYNTPEKKVKLEAARRKERRLLWETNAFIKETIEEDPEVMIYFEWPWPCYGWRQMPMEDLAQHMEEVGVPWLSCRIDGCNYGLRNEQTQQFIKKQWMVKTTDEDFHKYFRAKVCPGNHGQHCHIEGTETSKTAYYPWRMVQAIARHWRDRTAPVRHVHLLQCRDELSHLPDRDDDEEANFILREWDEQEPPTDVADEYEMQMCESERISLEALAREARLRERFDKNSCENIVMEVAAKAAAETRANSRWPQQPPFRILLGAYSHGAFSGVTRSSLKFPELNRFLNSYLRHWLPGLSWSSISLTVNGKTGPHRDHHNLKNSTNYIHGLGNFDKGGVWLEGQPPCGYTAVKRQLPNGSMVTGFVVPLNGQFVAFDPSCTHATQAWTGCRISITAFTTRLLPRMSTEDLSQLKKLCFPLETTTTELPRHVLQFPLNDKCLMMCPAATNIKEPEQGSKDEDDEEVPTAAREQWQAQIAKFHKAAGHPINRNLAKIVKDAGHPEWKVKAALEHYCPSCASLKVGGTSSGQVPPASTHAMYGAWEAVGVDSGEWIPPGGKKKVKFLLFMDLATKLRVVQPLFVYDFLEMKAESGEDFVRSFTDKWLANFPKPKVLVLDAAKSFVSEAVHDYASNVNIQLSYVAEKEPWAHGTLEAGVQDLKMTASAIYLEDQEQALQLTLILAASALNATEYTAGFTSYQWAFGREYSLTDEDVRTFETANYQDEFVRLVQARRKAEEIARSSRAKRVLSKLGNTTVRQPVRQFAPMDLVKVWRKVWPQHQFKGPRGGFKKSGRPHWIGPGRVVFHEVLPHQDHSDDRRHVVWVLVGSQLLRCSVHSVRPVTETERFQYETSGEDRSSTWRTLADVLPRREYHDIVDQAPQEDEVELPELPKAPDSSTLVMPTRRVSRKTTITASSSAEGGTTPAATSSTTPTRPLEETVNDYEGSEPKKHKAELTWVEELYTATEEPQDTIDIFSAFQETEEFMKIEFDLEPPQSNRQRRFLERDPVMYLVKKMKDSEVVMARLPEGEKKLFNRAKTKEVSSFIQNEAVRKCLNDEEVRRAVDSKRIVKARWVLTWKLVPPEDQEEAVRDSHENPQSVHTSDGLKKAKARIVLLGFQHPSLLDPTFKTASPVQSMLGRNLLYAMAADSQWDLEGLDLATAFLQTQPTEADQELWTTGVQELRDALGIGSEGVMRVLRNIYGSTTAPRGLWLSLHKMLVSLGAQPVLGERCLWIWLSKLHRDGEHAKVIGAMGGHVDDFHRIGDNSPEWLEIKEKINKAYKWGMTKTGSYRHAGTDVTTKKDENGFNKIVVDQGYYIEGLMDVDIEPDRLRSNEVLCKKDIEACRASLGALQWVAVQSQPQVCARCNLLLTDLVTHGTMETAREIQQLISETRNEPFTLTFQKFPKAKHWRDVVFISMGDQAHANRPKGDSTGGLVTLISGPESVTGCVCPMSLIGWRTWKLKRKAIGSNDAEVQSILEAEDHNFRARLLWSELHGAAGPDAERPLRQDLVEVVEKQILGIKGILCTDSKGGYDAVEVNESPLLGLSNMRAALQAFQLRGNLQRAACELRWLASDYDLADALTKKRADCREGLLQFLRTGHWCIKYDPSFTSAKKSKRAGRSAVGTVQKHLAAPLDDATCDAADLFWGWCNRLLLGLGEVGWRTRYTFLFTSEICLRVLATGLRKNFCTDVWYWSCLDVFIVLSSAWEIAVEAAESSDLASVGGVSSLKAFRIIRLTRTLRTVQFVRIFRFVVALRTLLTSIVSTLKALVWALLLLALIIYVFAVMFSQAVNDYLLDPEAPTLPEREHEACVLYFGSLWRTMTSLFMSIAGGTNWEELLFPLELISPVWTFAFLFYIAFTYFAVLNVVTGFFCQGAIESAQKDDQTLVQAMLDNKEAHMKRIEGLFGEIGNSGAGITYANFSEKVQEPAVRAYFESLGLDIRDDWTFFKLLDEDRDGIVAVEEFFLGCLRFRGGATSMDVAHVEHDQRWLISTYAHSQSALEEELNAIKDEVAKVTGLLLHLHRHPMLSI